MMHLDPCYSMSRCDERRSSLRIVARVAISAVLVAVVAACSLHHRNPDERAYPDSEPDISLSEALQDHGLALPANTSNIGFGVFTPREYNFYLKFDTACSVVPAFLAASGFKGVPRSGDIPEVVRSIGRRYGWDVDLYARPRGLSESTVSLDRSILIVNVSPTACRVFVVSYK